MIHFHLIIAKNQKSLHYWINLCLVVKDIGFAYYLCLQFMFVAFFHFKQILIQVPPFIVTFSSKVQSPIPIFTSHSLKFLEEDIQLT